MKLHSLKHTCIIPVLCAALLIPSYTVHADWEYNAEENTLRYKTKDGTYLTSVFRKIKGYTYYFDADGTVHTGWLDLKGDRYFFSESGAMLTSQWIGNKYLMKNGKMARSRWVDNHNVYVNKNGSRVAVGKKYKAKFIKTAQGTKYRNVDGTYSAKTWQSIKGYWYYFYSTGYMATNAQLGEYYVDKSGHMVKNKIVKIGKYYYRYGADGRFVKRSKTRSKLIPKKKHSKRHLSD